MSGCWPRMHAIACCNLGDAYRPVECALCLGTGDIGVIPHGQVRQQKVAYPGFLSCFTGALTGQVNTAQRIVTSFLIRRFAQEKIGTAGSFDEPIACIGITGVGKKCSAVPAIAGNT